MLLLRTRINGVCVLRKPVVLLHRSSGTDAGMQGHHSNKIVAVVLHVFVCVCFNRILGFSLCRNQVMRKKLILYFKRRNHARKQWVRPWVTSQWSCSSALRGLCVIETLCVCAGAEVLSALWPADGGLGEEGGAYREQPAAQGQREQSARVLRETVPRDPQTEGAAGAHAEVRVLGIMGSVVCSVMCEWRVCVCIQVWITCVCVYVPQQGGSAWWSGFCST